MNKALDDIVVVELSTEFWLATGAALLADFGARVIKIDRPTTGKPPGPEQSDEGRVAARR